MIPVLFSFSGPELTERERRFFQAAQPAGFILSDRNVVGRDQIRRLTSQLREILGRDRPPILIERGGGRRRTLCGPDDDATQVPDSDLGGGFKSGFPSFPFPAALGALYARDARAGVRASHLNARLIAADLFDCGVTVNIAPCLDLVPAVAHADLGGGAFSGDAHAVVALARAAMHGYRLEGISPCLLHIPGIGRSRSDRPSAPMVVDAPLEALRDSDFLPFKELADAPFAIAADAIYSSFDAEFTAMSSPDTIRKAIRGHCGFHGALLSSPVDWRGQPGSLAQTALTLVKAGCDAALYCSGRLPEMEAIAEVLPRISPDSSARFQAAELWGAMAPVAGDRKAFQAERDRLLALN